MSRDTIIDPEWEADERRREAERDARRHPKRYARDRRSLDEDFRDADDDGSVAPWDDPVDGSQTDRFAEGSGEDARNRREDWDSVRDTVHDDAWDDPERIPRRRRRRTKDEKLSAETADSGKYGGDHRDGDGRGGGNGCGDRDGNGDGDSPDAPPRKPSKLKEYIGSVLSGNILSKGEVRRLYPYLLFVAFLMLLYISNVFRMQQLHRRQETLTGQVKELRAKSLTISALRMNSTRQSEIMKELHRRGIPLEESLAPPKVVK